MLSKKIIMNITFSRRYGGLSCKVSWNGGDYLCNPPLMTSEGYLISTLNGAANRVAIDPTSMVVFLPISSRNAHIYWGQIGNAPDKTGYKSWNLVVDAAGMVMEDVCGEYQIKYSNAGPDSFMKKITLSGIAKETT